MTVEELVKVLDREVIFEVLQAYDREILFDSAAETYNRDRCYQKWNEVKNMIVFECYPTDTRELYIFVCPDFMQTEKECQ